MKKQKITLVKALPQWRTNIPDFDSMYEIGDSVERTLKPKDSPSLKEIMAVSKEPMKLQALYTEQRVNIITLKVKNQDPVEIELQTSSESKDNSKKRGIPALMLFGESIDPSSGLNNIVGGLNLPGKPLAFAVGTFEKPAILKFRPLRDGFLRVANWIIRGPLKPLTEKDKKISESMQKLFENNPAMKLANILNKESFIRLWNSKDFDSAKSSMDWIENNTQLTIRRGPEDAPKPRDLLGEFVTKMKINLSSYLSEEQKRWNIILDEVNTWTINLEEKLEAWASKNFQQDIFNEINPLLQKLTSWSKHAEIQAPLLKNARYYEKWSQEEIFASKLLSESLGDTSKLEKLESKASSILRALLANVGAISGVLIDKYGEMVAATSPDVKLTLHSDPSWKLLLNMSENELLATDKHNYLNYDFDSRTIALRINDFSNNLLGWLLLELYVSKVSKKQ